MNSVTRGSQIIKLEVSMLEVFILEDRRIDLGGEFDVDDLGNGSGISIMDCLSFYTHSSG